MKGVVSVGQKQRFSTLEIIRNWLVAFTRGFADSLRGAIELFLLDYRYWMRTCFVGELNHNWRFCLIFVDQVAEVNLKAVELVLPSFDIEEYKYCYTYLLYDTCIIVVKKLNLQASPAERAKAGAARD